MSAWPSARRRRRRSRAENKRAHTHLRQDADDGALVDKVVAALAGRDRGARQRVKEPAGARGERGAVCASDERARLSLTRAASSRGRRRAALSGRGDGCRCQRAIGPAAAPRSTRARGFFRVRARAICSTLTCSSTRARTWRPSSTPAGSAAGPPVGPPRAAWWLVGGARARHLFASQRCARCDLVFWAAF